MGNTISGHSVCQALKDLLKVKGIGLKKETLENFLKAVDQVAPWFPESGHLNQTKLGEVRKRFEVCRGMENPHKRGSTGMEVSLQTA